ncbi:MAG: succinate--CoA ligase subunit alpha [Candidatus Melainabacteria bacterium RIFCSPLOWO2_02_FULL_35_15]|nr:MAG: succinate--CoA ligase subunit alpha [Candidatus Melainabacteria bacterium RIFCSPLOWO2_12_FULL_35_11]OGI13519.1 MAG: succinate--CoA ligase subunit alpha [Candidatus Melainabacteria bacterium RIFCSPLOWO2_02_FULL_35_15]
MAVLVNKETKIIIQGITGNMGKTHTGHMLKYGTKITAGVTPGKGGQEVHGVKVYDTVKEAKDKTGATASCIFVPGYFVLDAVYEAFDAGMELVVIITEGIPPHDEVKIIRRANELKIKVIGPNCPGIITPGECLIGIHPGIIYKPGKIGMLSRSGTLTYEVALALTNANIGQSTCIGIGGDPVIGLGFNECLKLFNDDKNTEAIVLIGEIGGTAEEETAELIKKEIKKPVVAYIAGRTAPSGKRMGHAGAIISGGKGTAESKVKAFRDANVQVADIPSQIVDLIKKIIKEPMKV